MTTHPPHHPTHSTDPGPDRAAALDRDGDGPPLVDLVAGDPPVPITVWRTARSGDDRGATIPARLARRLVAAYSRPGEAVVDLTDDHALTAACRVGERRHHRAWFTDVASLIIGPATTDLGTDSSTGDGAHVDADDEAGTDRPARRGGARPARAVPCASDGDEAPGAGEVDESTPAWALADWFGDDLTDPQLPPTGPSVAPIADGVPLTGRTSLVVASWPLDPDPAGGGVRLAWLLAACRDLLRPGGCLVLVVAMPTGHPAAGHSAAGQPVTPEDFSPIVDAAARTGLGYLQHIVAVAADIAGEHGDTFVYHVDDEELLTLSRARARADGETWTVAHLRVHADLLVFTPTKVASARGARTRSRRGAGRDHGAAGREGGGHRG